MSKIKNFNKIYKKIKKSNLFDEKFYKKTYNEVKGDALKHYLIKGYKQHYHPSLNFDNNLYNEMYPDIHDCNMNPLVHYILNGKSENRKIKKVPYISRKKEIIRNNLPFLNNFHIENEPLVSIIILNHNGLHHLKKLFKDFNKKTNYSNYEIIVVDNNSTDDSINYLESLDIEIKIIKNNENLSFSKANNEAVKIANGDYVLFLHNDIEPTFGWLNELVGTILKNDKIAIVGSKLIYPYYFTGNIKNSFKIQHCGLIYDGKHFINYDSDSYIFDKSLNKIDKRIAVNTAATLIRKGIFNELHGFDENYFYGLEDIDFCLKAYKKGYYTLYSGASLLFHNKSNTIRNMKNNYTIFNNKWKEYLFKQLLLDKINNTHLFTKKQLKIAIFSEKNNNISKIAKDFNNMGYEIELINNFNEDFIADILISFNESFICKKDILKILISNLNNKKDYDLVCNFSNENFAKEFINYLKNYLISKNAKIN